jgi:hypothetical protein
VGRINDVGGVQGFGRCRARARRAAFHADWEAHVFAMNRALIGAASTTSTSSATPSSACRRGLPRVVVLREVVLAITTLCVEKGVLTRRGATVAERFAPGDARAHAATDPPHHTRLPRYARGAVGTVVETEGRHPLADDRAAGLPAEPEPSTPSASRPASCSARATTPSRSPVGELPAEEVA